MTADTGFWTLESSRRFHNAVAELRRLTETPSRPEYYRGRPPPDLGGHVLSFEDELQIADNVAYLAHQGEGVGMVSAVTLQERPSGLAIVLASNETPSPSVVKGLKHISGIVSRYAMQGGDRQVFCQSLFRQVLQLCRQRILQRIRPPWMPTASHIRKRRPFLQCKFQEWARDLSEREGSHPQLYSLYDRVCGLVDSLEPLRNKPEESRIDEVLETVITKCAELATVGKARSLEEHVQSLGLWDTLHEASEIRQVDKLARYLFLCKDFTRLARKKRYQPLFQQIDVIRLKSYAAVTPPGLSRRCFVHAETRQILYHETNAQQPAPRCIGCSKSACYLCDLLISKQNRYRISHAHRRLYDQWTIPVVSGMSKEKKAFFARLIRDMTQELTATIRQYRVGGHVPGTPYPLESRAFLPLSSGGSTVTDATIRALPARAPPSGDDRSRQSSAPSYVDLTTGDLLFHREIQAGARSVEVRVGRLYLTFDFAPQSSGHLFVSRIDDNLSPSSSQILSVEALDIPTHTEMGIGGDSQTNQTKFQMRNGRHFCVEISFLWEGEGKLAVPLASG